MKTLPLFFAIAIFPVFLIGQEKDTSLARIYTEKAKELRDSLNYEESIKYLEKATVIYGNFFGKNSAEYADALYKQGFILTFKGDVEEALAVHHKVLKIRNKLYTEPCKPLVNSHFYLGWNYMKNRAFPKAIYHSEKALELGNLAYGEGHIDNAKTLNALGVLYNKKGAYEKSISYFEESVKIKIKNLGENDSRVADEYAEIGDSYSDMGDYPKSLNYYNKALNIYESAKDLDPLTKMKYYGKLGGFYYRIGQMDKALELDLKSLQTSIKKFGENHKYTSYYYQNVATSYFAKGNYQKAIENIKKSIAITEKEFGEFSPRLASTYSNLGVYYSEIGDYSKGMDYYYKSLNINKKAYGEGHPKMILNYSNIGTAYLKMRDYQLAEKVQKDLLNLLKEKFPDRKDDIAFQHYYLTTIFEQTNEYDKARFHGKKAIEIWNQLKGKNHLSTLDTYYKLASVEVKDGNCELAIEIISDLIPAYQDKLGNLHPSISNCYGLLANCALKNEAFSDSEELIAKSIQALGFDGTTIETVDDLDILYKALNEEAEIKLVSFQKTRKKEYLDKSLQSQLKSLEVIDYLRKKLSEEGSKELLSEKTLPVYEQAISIYYQLWEETGNSENLEQAFVLSERSKSLLLYESIQEADAYQFAGIPENLLEQEKDLGIEISYWEKMRFDEIAAGAQLKDSLIGEYDNKIFALKRTYETLKNTFELDYPEYYQLKYDLAVMDVKNVQKSLLNPQQALLEYFVGEKSIFLFLVTPDQFNVERIEKNFPLETWVKDLRESILNYYTLANRTATKYDEMNQLFVNRSYALYQKLVNPVANSIPEKMLIIPDGILGYLPFEILLVEKPSSNQNLETFTYLIENQSVNYCYSATLHNLMVNKKHKENSNGLLAFAPSFKGDDLLIASRGLDLSLRSNQLQPLKFNLTEVESIQSLVGGNIFSNAEATEKRFCELAPKYRILHLATHGKANDESGEYSFLAFYELEDSLENEWLYVKDLYNLELNADMVVLSACETGIGELKKGEGIVSLARGFSYAGAKSIITSLWNVDDKKTAELIETFYKNLKMGIPKDEALRNAKLEYLKSNKGQLNHPFFWAGMVVIGDSTPIRFGGIGVLGWFLATLVILMIFWWWRKRKGID